jgi:hypothetical protein
MTRLASLLFGCAAWLAGAADTAALTTSSAQARIDALGVPFVPNAGQWDSEAAFAARTFAGVAFVTTNGQLVHRLAGTQRDGASRAPGWVIRETLVDSNGQPRSIAPRGSDEQAGRVSFAVGGDASRHRDALPGYANVQLLDAYPGIDARLRATGTNVEKIFTVAPGRDPATIRIRLDGALGLDIGSSGELIARTGNGPVTYTAPIAWQDDAHGRRHAVDVRYALDAVRGTYGFAVGAYDAALPLVIDPLLQSTYVGGNGSDIAYAMAIHPVTGEVYIAGSALSTDFPKTTGAEQTTKASGYDAFVTRLNAALTTRLQSTYLGGDSNDLASALAIHPASGEVYVAGYTDSSDFPDAAGGAQDARNGSNGDAFITRLNAALTSRIQSTYHGGTAVENTFPIAIAIHPVTGDVYIAGSTASTDLPDVAGAEQTVKNTGTDAYITRFNAALTARPQSTYFGNTGEETINAIAIHPFTGDVYVAGATTSPVLPKSTGAEQPIHAAGATSNDAFVARLNANLTTIIQSTFIGGDLGDDIATSLAVHPWTGEVYVGGYTVTFSFPKVGGAEQTARGGGSAAMPDGFVTRLDPALVTRLQSTYLGGNGSDYVNALAIHPLTGEVYVAGSTTSTDFPKLTGGVQTVKGAGNEAFVTRLNAALTSRVQSTYFGGGGSDFFTALAIHPGTGEIYTAGSSTSTDLGGLTGAEQSVKATADDAIVSRYSPDLTLSDNTPVAFAFTSQANAPLASLVTSAPAQVSGLIGATNIYVDGRLGASYCISSTSGCSCDLSGGFLTGVSTITNNAYVCVRQLSAPLVNAVTSAVLHVGGGASPFFVSTGAIPGGCTLDVDGNNAIDALTDGLMLIRAMFGLTGTSVTANAVGGNASRTTWEDVRSYLNGNCGANFAP